MGETRRPFHHQLDEIHDDLVRMAARVTEGIPRATDVLLSGDLLAAQTIIEGDDEIDALTLDIEDRCYTVLARQQPMAGDMRALVTALRLSSEIERSGDLVVNLAKSARRLHGMTIPPRLRGLIATMSDQAARLFSLAAESYRLHDEALAAALDDLDDPLDQAHRDFIVAMIDGSRDDLDLQPAVQLALVGRYYERIGDHAVNIGERVRFMVSGWLPEQTGAARFAARHDKPRDAEAEVEDDVADDEADSS